MALPCLFIAYTSDKGRGVFTREALPDGTLIEEAPVIVLSGEDREKIDQTLLHDYIFEWDPRHRQCCMALGLVPIYNHACPSNCEYEMDYAAAVIRIRTVRAVRSGEEMTINYNGNFDDDKPLWFTVK
jgi:SET domain-containing protein